MLEKIINKDGQVSDFFKDVWKLDEDFHRTPKVKTGMCSFVI